MIAAPPAPASRREIVCVAALALVPLLPFLSAAVSIDAPVFLAVARQIVTSPADPFGFEMIWDPTSPLVAVFNRNPPLLSYWLAPWIAAFGEREWILHAVLLPFPLMAALAFYGIARRVAGDGLAPAALLVVTPAFLILGTTLMLDVPVLAWMLLAAYALLRSVERERPPRSRVAWELAAGGAAAAAGLTKYVGFSIAPLLAAGIVLLAARPGPALVRTLGIPLFVWALWGAWTAKLYGSVHFWVATDLVQEKSFKPDDFWNQVASVPIYCGAALVFPIFVWARTLLRGRKGTEIAVIGILLGAAVARYVLPDGDPPRRFPLEGDEAALAVAGFASAFFLWGLCLRPSRVLASALDRWLGLWLAGFLFFSMLVNWHVNAVDAVLTAPPLILMIFRAPELRPTRKRVALWVALLLPLSVLLAWSDTNQAGFYRTAARKIAAEIGESPGDRWFVGHWGLQYYLEREGFRAVVPPQYERWYGASVLKKDDWVSSSRNVSQLDVSRNMSQYRLRGVWTWEQKSWLPLRTTNADAGAGFYSHHSGYVPFGWKDVPVESVGLGRVVGIHRAPKEPLR
ncbi:MAG: phospholipid carrier-dependent glycosyltransferase [Myxococcales bacterium]|nr:phospholipid carrier-dependent glycosyltransferase [Myxococcales bacterium]